MVFTQRAGLDVHTKTVMACRATPAPLGQQADGRLEVRGCGTRTRDLSAVSDWWTEAGITHVARERTGAYWKPVSNLREGTCTVYGVSAFDLPSRHEPYHDLGATDCEAHRREPLGDRLTRRLEHLGYRVSREPVPAA